MLQWLGTPWLQSLATRHLAPLTLVSVCSAFVCANGGASQYAVRQWPDQITLPSTNSTPHHSIFPRESTDMPCTQRHTCNNDGYNHHSFFLPHIAPYRIHSESIRAVNNCVLNDVEKIVDSCPAAFELFPIDLVQQDEAPSAKLLVSTRSGTLRAACS